MTQRADDRFGILIVAGRPATVAFLCIRLLILGGRSGPCVLRPLSRTRRRLPITGCGRGRIIGWVLLLFLFRSFAKKHPSDFLHPDLTVLEHTGELKKEDKIALQGFPVAVLEFSLGDALGQSLELGLLYVEF